MANLSFTEQGNGRPVILVHGFPFNQVVWSSFAEKLAETSKVVTIDLPGFGKSQLMPIPFSISDVAKEVNSWLTERDIVNPVIVGHSLGGYVALAMVEQQPDAFAGLVLFHSTAYADTDEKKQNRNKVIEFIDANGVHAFTSNFIPPLYADPKHPSIAKVRDIATQATERAVKGYTIAMRDRIEKTSVLRDFPNAVLIISGDQDGGIPVDSVKKQAALSPHIQLTILPGVGHMGMFEKEEDTLKLIRQFVTE